MVGKLAGASAILSRETTRQTCLPDHSGKSEPCPGSKLDVYDRGHHHRCHDTRHKPGRGAAAMSRRAIRVSEWLVPTLLRASAGLAVAALLVAACVRLLHLRSPRVEQVAWLLVLIQGIVLVPISVPVARGTVRPEVVHGDDGSLVLPA